MGLYRDRSEGCDEWAANSRVKRDRRVLEGEVSDRGRSGGKEDVESYGWKH